MAGRPRTTTPKVQGSPQTSGPIMPLDLLTYEGPLYVQNHTTQNGVKSILSVNLSQTQGDSFRLGPEGNVMGDDHQVLPLAVAQNPGFQKAWRRGQVTVTTDAAMEEKLILASMRLDENTRLPIEAELMRPASSSDITPGTGDFQNFLVTEAQARNPRLAPTPRTSTSVPTFVAPTSHSVPEK